MLSLRLAAVDMHTARHIVKHCFQGALAQNRTIILVTHHISLCIPSSSYIVELSHGKIVRQGSVSDLQEQGVLKAVVRDEDVSENPPSKENEEPMQNDTAHIQKKLVKEEYRKEGRVSGRTYFDYIKTSGWIAWTLTFVLMALMRMSAIANSVSLS